jgi:hypothetical protein
MLPTATHQIACAHRGQRASTFASPSIVAPRPTHRAAPRTPPARPGALHARGRPSARRQECLKTPGAWGCPAPPTALGPGPADQERTKKGEIVRATLPRCGRPPRPPPSRNRPRHRGGLGASSLLAHYPPPLCCSTLHFAALLCMMYSLHPLARDLGPRLPSGRGAPSPSPPRLAGRALSRAPGVAARHALAPAPPPRGGRRRRVAALPVARRKSLQGRPPAGGAPHMVAPARGGGSSVCKAFVPTSQAIPAPSFSPSARGAGLYMGVGAAGRGALGGSMGREPWGAARRARLSCAEQPMRGADAACRRRWHSPGAAGAKKACQET